MFNVLNSNVLQRQMQKSRQMYHKRYKQSQEFSLSKWRISDFRKREFFNLVFKIYILYLKSYISAPPFWKLYFFPSAVKILGFISFPLQLSKLWVILFPLDLWVPVPKIMHSIYLPHFSYPF